MGTLYIVATPIGNLKDITYRAVETLASVDVIACEDVLHSMTLLNAYNIKAKCIPYHKFNEKSQQDKILSLLSLGKNVALITDAGTPLISDPGYVLVSRARKLGYSVTTIPGACACISALTISGLDTTNFYFFGFLPEKKSARLSALQDIKNLKCTIIFYIAPHSLKEDIASIATVFGARKAVLVNEITKVYEKAIDFCLTDNLEITPKGEYVLVVSGASEQNNLNSLSIEDHIAHYIAMGIDKKDALKLVAHDRNTTKSEIYKHTIKSE